MQDQTIDDAERSAQRTHLTRLDGLRAIAALAIVVSHTWLYAPPDGRASPVGHLASTVLRQMPLGVTLFFSLSGYLLYRPWAAAVLDGTPRPDVRRYARHRAFRIVPAYIVILLIIGFVMQVASLRDAQGDLYTGSMWGHPFTFGMCLLLVQGYLPRTLLTGIGPAWSLTTEVAFYALLPLLGLMAAGLGRAATSRRVRLVAVATPAFVMLGIGIAGKVLSAYVIGPGNGVSPGYDADWASVIDRSILGNADLFVPGMLLAIVGVEVTAGRWHLPRWWRPVAFWGAVLLAGATATFLSDDVGQSHQLSAYPYATLMAIPCGLLVALTALPAREGSRPVLHRILGSRVLVAVGIVSYSLFLWNEPLAHWLSERGVTFSGAAGLLPNLVLVVGIGLVLSALSYRFVERPAMRRRR